MAESSLTMTDAVTGRADTAVVVVVVVDWMCSSDVPPCWPGSATSVDNGGRARKAFELAARSALAGPRRCVPEAGG